MTEPGQAADPETTVDAAPSADTELAGVAEGDTQSAYAWGQTDDLDQPPQVDELDEPSQRWWTPGRITAVAVISSVLLAAAVAGAAYRHIWGGPGSAASPQTSAASATMPATLLIPIPATPTTPVLQGVDGEFIAAMRAYGVPVNEQDPEFTVIQGTAICKAAEDNPRRYPPGKDTVLAFVKYIKENNPGWTQQQATRLAHGGVDYYCPWVWGPSPEEIAAMPPDQRYLAMLLDRLGITPSDNGVSLINAARQWCSLKAQGWGNGRVVNETTLDGNNREDLPEMVQIAIDVYCPEFSGG
ncbi:MAG: DUF732 domain-containing protein [Microbacteriaceae bacterium]